MPDNVDKARDELLERLAHTVYRLAIEVAILVPDNEGNKAFNIEADEIDKLLTEFIRARRNG